MNNKCLRREGFRTFLMLSMAAVFALCAVVPEVKLDGNDHRAEPLDQERSPLVARPADPELVVSADACVKCHPAEVSQWRKTPHALAYEELHRRPEAKEIASKLGVRSIKYDARCVACHYTQQQQAERTLVIAGISCESCHGAARNWIESHGDYGGAAATRATESAEHRTARVEGAIAAGMRNPRNVYLLAQSCYRCHTVQDEELVNVGGHSFGSLDFELVSWSQGMIHHNFLSSQGMANEPSSPERLRVMFVAGMIADLEASLRAVARATTVSDFGVNAAKRSARAAVRLRSVLEKVDHQTLRDILACYDPEELRVENRTLLEERADRIAEYGRAFAEQVDPRMLEVLETFIPAPERWK